uniref:single-stranded DNA-binding protein n=1 Tax=Agathobacter sp. TaxID=2021311 RepID=UPI0040578F8C
MNTVNLMGRLVETPQTKYPANEKEVAVTHYTLAVNTWAKDKMETAYIRCTAFGRLAEIAETYFYKGVKVAVSGRIKTGSYEKDGQKIYTTEVIIEKQEFAESRKAATA